MNSYFQFKQFRIEQDRCAMKVCTDSCILGAYTNYPQAKTILDIGTGTGLLALMLAQKQDSIIDAVEIEQNAFQQASENIKASPWKKNIHIYHTSIQEFGKTSPKYDLIISNPPFFTNQLKSPKGNKNIAHHNELLSFDELINSVASMLNPQGKFVVLLPAYEYKLLKEKATKHHLYVNETLSIKDRKDLPVLRIISTFSFEEKNCIEAELIIKNNSGEYTHEFKELLKDYYLHL